MSDGGAGDRIEIRDLTIEGIIGVLEHERHTPQPIVVNLTLHVDLRAAGESDALADTVDYQRIADLVTAHTLQARRRTVEALAADLARLCLQQPGVDRVGVRVEKPAALADAASVGVEIERQR